MTVLSNIITPSNVLTTTNTATVTNKTLTSPTVTGMVVSDGTANGVTYLNGSKVLTSGSALNFNGTSLAVGDAASSADGSSLYIYGNLPASTQLGIKIGGNANSYTQQAIRFYDTYFGAYAGFLGFTTNSLTFGQGTTEGMRLTSTGLGIGTSSPAAKLHVSTGTTTNAIAGNAVAGFTSNSNAVLSFNVPDANAAGLFFGYGGNAYWAGMEKDGVAGLRFVVAGNEMRLNSSGNLGLGVTPSAWGSASSRRAIELPGGGNIWDQNFGGSNPSMQVYCNAYESSTGARYVNSAHASGYQQNAGSHVWSTAPSGTAGNAISFTQAMSLLSDGSLLVGKTAVLDSTVGFQVSSGGRVSAAMASGDAYILYSTSASAYRFYVTNAGVVNATSTTITAISDQRLKENIRDLDDGLDVVMALKPRKFDWKEGKGENIKNARGFIAQEFEKVLPDMIETWRDPAPEGEEAYKAINANLTPTLVKAIQEQQAIIESLKARLDAANL